MSETGAHIVLDRQTRTRYPGKPQYYVRAVDAAGTRMIIGKVEQVVKSGKWFYNAGWGGTKQGPYATREEAVAALIRTEASERRARRDRAAHELQRIEDAASGPMIVNERGW